MEFKEIMIIDGDANLIKRLELINHLPRINDFIKCKDIKQYVKLVCFNFDSEKIEILVEKFI